LQRGIISAQARRIEYIRCVDCKAEELDRQGYDVKANIGGWSTPETIGGLVPDIRAKRGNKVIIGRVLRPEDLKASEEEMKKFIDFALRDENTSFRIYLSSDDGKPQLHKIY
jgi:hypothetical protein